MFKYGNFRIARQDEHNVILEELREKEIHDKGKKTGKTREVWHLHGYFSCFENAFRRMVSLCFEGGEDIRELKKILEEMRELTAGVPS